MRPAIVEWFDSICGEDDDDAAKDDVSPCDVVITAVVVHNESVDCGAVRVDVVGGTAVVDTCRVCVTVVPWLTLITPTTQKRVKIAVAMIFSQCTELLLNSR